MRNKQDYIVVWVRYLAHLSDQAQTHCVPFESWFDFRSRQRENIQQEMGVN